MNQHLWGAAWEPYFQHTPQVILRMDPEAAQPPMLHASIAIVTIITCTLFHLMKKFENRNYFFFKRGITAQILNVQLSEFLYKGTPI